MLIYTAELLVQLNELVVTVSASDPSLAPVLEQKLHVQVNSNWIKIFFNNTNLQPIEIPVVVFVPMGDTPRIRHGGSFVQVKIRIKPLSPEQLSSLMVANILLL